MAPLAPPQRYQELCAAIAPFGSAAVAFSGGVDSSLLLHAARRALGERAVAFHAVSSLHTAPERTRAAAIAARQGCRLVTFAVDPLTWPEFVANPPNRCYLCKQRLYSLFVAALKEQGCNVLLDGTNGDDLLDDRPGLAVLRELGVRTPLAGIALGKAEVRRCARWAGLANWDAPSASCLATRILPGHPITPENIALVAELEEYLGGQGFLGCRARWGGSVLRIEVREKDLPKLATLLGTPSFHKMASRKALGAIEAAKRVDR